MHFVEEEHFQSGQVGFPLLLNKALKLGQGGWIWGLYKLDFCKRDMFRVGKWGRLSLAAKQSIEVGSIGMGVVLQVGLFGIKACSDWASGLSRCRTKH